MLDRLELFTSRSESPRLRDYFAGRHGVPACLEKQNLLLPLDRVSSRAKLVREDEDLRELRLNEFNPLYKRVLTLHVVADLVEGEEYDDPISLVIFASPRFRRDRTDRYKIVCNPSQLPFHRLIGFLDEFFPRSRHETESEYLNHFRLGRVDFSHDTEEYSVEELYRMIHVRRNLRTQTELHDLKDAPASDGFIRIISNVTLGTVYVGKGQYMLRIYDKVREAQHQAQVCRAQGWQVPEVVKRTSEMRQLTRIEYQVRDLGKSGYREQLNTKTGEIKRVFDPRRPHHNLRTLADLVDISPTTMDLFTDVQFRPITTMERKERGWKTIALNALIERYGYDETLRILPEKARREARKSTRCRLFVADLDTIQIGDIRQWLRD